MSIWLLWLLIVVVPNVKTVSEFFIGIPILILTVLVLAFVVEREEYIKNKTLLTISALFIFVGTLCQVSLPDKEQMVYLVGGYFVTNIDGIEKLPPNLANSANKFLEDYINAE